MRCSDVSALPLSHLHTWLASVLTAERAEGEFDAAEIDRELIASRLRQEVVRTTCTMSLSTLSYGSTAS